MYGNAAEDWQRLSEQYRSMFDGELEELARSLGDLTPTAQEVLRGEMKSRGLSDPLAPRTETRARPAAAERAGGALLDAAPSRWASAVDPDAVVDDLTTGESDEGDTGDGPRGYTWKTLLCECDTTDEAWQLHEVLKRAGIDSWVEGASGRGGGFPSVVVAADQLDRAIEVANQPIPQEIIDDSKVEVPEFVPPKCPACGADDPVLESAEPTNSWLCEACGKQWTEPVVGEDRMPKPTGH